jgi:diguanylate cyclase (GGDEF)-like protein/PAS domain S-box-containing protein
LSGLSSDWYWEQDADLRFTRVDVQLGAPGEQELANRILGKQRWETGIQVEGGWEAHRALLEAREPFRDVLMWRDFDDGSRRYVSTSGEPVFDAQGRFAGYRGVGRDVTQQKRGELLLRMQHAVTQCLAEASAAAEGIECALRAICEAEGWERGEFRRLDPADGVLRPFVRWIRPGACAARGADGSPQALEVPVPSGGHVAGVMAFGSVRLQAPDEPLRAALAALGTQLGLFLRRSESEARLRESEERYRRTFELAASGIAHIALDRRFVRVNRRLCEIFGYPQAELLGKTGRDISHPGDLDVINTLRPRLYAGEVETVSTEKRYLRKDGSTVWVTLTLALERDAAGQPLHEIAVYDDITARKAAEAALRESEERFRSLTEMSSDFFYETDAAHRFLDIVHGSDYAGKIGRDLIGKAPWELPSTHPDAAGWAALRALVDARSAFRDFEFGRPWRDGTVRYFSVSGEPHFAADGAFLGYRGVGRDITEVMLARERIASLAYQDALTGLANRASLAPTLRQAVERTRRRGSKLAGLFIDLDGFKQVNDAHGHDAGDRLLIEAAHRLRASLRAGDPVARLGGDEFFAVLEDMHDALPVERVAQKLLAAIREPYDLGGGRRAVVSASIGISLFPDDADDAEALIKHADIAMYGVKQAGKSAYRFFGARAGGAGR